MPSIEFEHTIRFRRLGGRSFPIVRVTLITESGSDIEIPLLFDTGASDTTFKSDLYPYFGLSSWDEGQLVPNIPTAGGTARAYRYDAKPEFYGKRISCPIHLMEITTPPAFDGLLGRDTIMQEFGFGFWESTQRLYGTESS